MEYQFVVAWGRFLGSMNYYIQGQVDKARAEKAPERAIYRQDDGTWATIDQVRSPLTRDTIIKMVEGMKK